MTTPTLTTERQARAPGRPTALLCLCVVLLLSISCAGQPREISTPVQLPEGFSETGSEAVPDRWWAALDDPRLAGLIERALDGNFSLKAAWDRLDQARAVARRQGAALWPQLDGTASASRSVRETELPGEDERTYGDEFSLGLTASYEVDVWGRVRATRDAARLSADATEQDLRSAALSLSAQVANVWYRLVEQQAQLDLLDRQIQTNESYLSLVELRFRKGEVSALDVLQQRKLVESTRTEKSRVQAQVETLRHQLAVLTGAVPKNVDLPDKAELPELPRLPETGVPGRWVKQRPDIRSAHLRVQSRDRELAAAIADQFPRFSISGRFQSTAAEPSQLLEDWLASLAAGMTAPLVDGDRRNAEVDRARAAASESLHDYAQTVLTGVQEVEDALTNERQQRKAVDGVRRQLALSNRTVNQLWQRYRNGTVNFLRVLDELRTQQQLQRSVLSAEGQLVRDRVDLYRALGGAWQMERPEDISANPFAESPKSEEETSEEPESAQMHRQGGANS